MPAPELKSLLCGAAIIALLSGCSDSNALDAALDDYRARIQRVLDTPLPPYPDTEALQYPDSQDRQADIAPLSINLTQWYGFKRCELATLVAERNTALGKTAQPSQRLLYEARLLQAFQACLQQLGKDDDSRRELLMGWQQQKQHQYPLVWANLIQNSAETRQALSISQGYLQAEDNTDATAAVQAIGYLHTLREPEAVSDTDLEAQLQVLASSRLPARIWRTQARLTDTLQVLNEALATPFTELPCPGGRASEQVTILRNVFYLFFINQIQPVGSKLNHFTYLLQPVWQAWTEENSLQPPFRNYLSSHSVTGFARYQATIKQHVRLWQDLLARCNLSPQAPSAN